MHFWVVLFRSKVISVSLCRRWPSSLPDLAPKSPLDNDVFLIKILAFLTMGAPKQKWTAEEEAALKAGVRKHGAGKWQTILRDPEFSDVLRSRSNVDLKDKWRNINVTTSGLGSREKARLALKRNPQTPKRNEKHGSLNGLAEGAETAAEPKLHSVSSFSDKLHFAESKINFTRLESVILEALTTLKEPKGSEKNAIATYIELSHNIEEDPRFKLFNKDWFHDKDCLDIGCNSGLITINIAKKFHCRSLLGIDIDRERIEGAKRLLMTESTSLSKDQERETLMDGSRMKRSLNDIVSFLNAF